MDNSLTSLLLYSRKWSRGAGKEQMPTTGANDNIYMYSCPIGFCPRKRLLAPFPVSPRKREVSARLLLDNSAENYSISLSGFPLEMQ